MPKFLIFGAERKDCSHCGTMKDFAKNNNVNFEFIMVAENIKLSNQYRIRSIPTAVRVSDGARLTGTGGMKDFFKV